MITSNIPPAPRWSFSANETANRWIGLCVLKRNALRDGPLLSSRDHSGHNRNGVVDNEQDAIRLRIQTVVRLLDQQPYRHGGKIAAPILALVPN
jgi:hypothetical protein